MKYYAVLIFLSVSLIACQQEKGPLPYLGQPKMKNGVEKQHTIPSWEFLDQDSLVIKDSDFANGIYVADFFFISCPTICPRVAKEMKRMYEAFEGDDRVKFVSFTIDPKRDTPERLKQYARDLEVNTDQWKFIHTNKETIYDLANEYFVVAYEDQEVPGGFDHSGKIILIDQNGHVRSFSEGTQPDETPGMIKDINRLLEEMEQKDQK